MIRKECEFCGLEALMASDETVCRNCDLKMVEEQRLFELTERTKAAARRCRDCSEPLTPGHWYRCKSCMVSLERQGADAGDEFYATIHAITPPRHCKLCDQTKPLTEFAKDRRAKNGHQGVCKKCACARTQFYQERKKQNALSKVS